MWRVLILGALVLGGCTIDTQDIDAKKGYSECDRCNAARLEVRLTERLNAMELHLSQRLERIERQGVK